MINATIKAQTECPGGSNKGERLVSVSEQRKHLSLVLKSKLAELLCVEEVVCREPASNHGGCECGPVWGKKNIPE